VTARCGKHLAASVGISRITSHMGFSPPPRKLQSSTYFDAISTARPLWNLRWNYA